ncbi:hypothetical protein [Sphingomonas sp. S2-65]|uniref:hypothetical protein n=1 Tax=Sphingomonas sp. S2-65 TaxID=2903960 RepID=UPI001F18585C|nr:hypothetical protein [Sphingomonas sp. S2-65]UYY56856.1 hypothetical protein LZ586_09080 [Sphingomonas sp. S2-65]
MLEALIAATSLFLISAEAAPAPAAYTWRTYVNVRFGYRICYPANLLLPQPEAPNGDGRVFVAADSATLTVFGRNNAEQASLSKTAAELASDRAGSKGSVRYRLVRRNWAVSSGEDGGSKLFYGKTILRDDQFIIFDLVYPKALAAQYKPVVEQLARCFAASG